MRRNPARRTSLRDALAPALASLLLAGCLAQPAPQIERLRDPPGGYAFPITDPYLASVIGTPPPLQVELPREIPRRERSVRLVERPLPPVFFYDERLRYSVARRRGPAPLMFIVAGNNAGYHGRFNVFLQALYFAAGFHAVSLSSSTYPNFMAAASTTGVPGRTDVDAADLYRAMRTIRNELEADGVEIESVSLTGYSLGAWLSAFVARRDGIERGIGLHRVVLINPPVSLYRSSRVLDQMLEENIPGGLEGLGLFIDRMLSELSRVLRTTGPLELSQDVLHRVALDMRLEQTDLRALVGLSFRLASANIGFAADAITRFGYIVPPDAPLGVATPLTPYFDAAMQRGFTDYFEQFLLPFYRQRDPQLEDTTMIARSSMESIAPFLEQAPHVRLVGNADDIILAPGDIDILARLFAGRSTIFPTGGHCGNMFDRHVAAAIVRAATE